MPSSGEETFPVAEIFATLSVPDQLRQCRQGWAQTEVLIKRCQRIADRLDADPENPATRQQFQDASEEYVAQTSRVDEKEEALVANFVAEAELPELPGLAPREVPGRLQTPTCYEEIWLPSSQEEWKQSLKHGFKKAYCPWLPGPEDLSFLAVHGDEIEQAWGYFNGEVETQISAFFLSRRLKDGIGPKKWQIWAGSKRILGVEIEASEARAEQLKIWLGKGHDGAMRMPGPEEVEAAMQGTKSAVAWGAEKGADINIAYAYRQMALLRWEIEEGLDLYPQAENRLLDAYTNLLAAMEFNYPEHGIPRHEVFNLVDSYATLLMGGRDTQEGFSTACRANGDHYLDYVDAFFLLAAELRLMRSDYLKQSFMAKFPQRCLFGSHSLAFTNPVGIFMTMAAMYFRMTPQQRQTFDPIIMPAMRDVSHKMAFDWVVTEKADQLHVPGGSLHQRNYPEEGEKPLSEEVELAKFHHMRGLRFFKEGKKRVFKQGWQVPLGTKMYVETGWPYRIEGYGSERFVIEDKVLRFVGGETEETQAETGLSLRPEEVTLAVTAAERIGPEMQLAIQEMLLAKPEVGKLECVSSVATMLEMLLGEKVKSTELHEILLWLGQISQQADSIGEASHDELVRILDECRKRPDFASADTLSQLMIMYSVFGVLPKEMVVERVLESFKAAGEIYPVRLALLFENMSREDLAGQGLDLAGYSSPVFAGREAIAQARAAGLEPEQAPYRLLVEKQFAKALEHIGGYMQYDWSMTSVLRSLMTAEKQGVFFAQCLPQAEVMVGLMGLMAPGIKAFPIYRIVDDRLSLAEWYASLEKGNQPIAFDHMLAEADFRDQHKDVHACVADVTEARLMLTDRIEYDHNRTSRTANSRVANYPRLRRLGFPGEIQAWKAIGYGSEADDQTSLLLAALAADFPELECYREEFAPDDVFLNKEMAADRKHSQSQRLDALHKLLQVAPREVARYMEAAKDRGSFLSQLQEQIDLVVEARDFIPAIFLTNILAHTRAASPEMKEGALAMRQSAIKQLVVDRSSRESLEKGLSYFQDILTEADREEIIAAWESFQAELAAQKEKQQEFVEQFLHQAKVDYASAMVEARREAKQIDHEETRARKETLLEDKSLGEVTAEVVAAADRARNEAVVAQNQAGVVDAGLFTHLIQITPGESEAALRSILKAVPPEKIDACLLGLQLLLYKSEATHYFKGSPELINAAWTSFAEAAKAVTGRNLPCSRAELRLNGKAIVARHGLLVGGSVTRLIEGN
ncbi:hypothetical protein A2160_05635 [Candidatus Beckwithbacteria bacterium RBG_13_42_9]|uniref:Uncharacterized protein n=1 Tax=Candidatus Beckwithbacteria bacterium RBG_13_42_9 TaxID=1797457 RepID=A0A1F5E602_9BACT|nr:MAG: hypothetical protein A2160_05635 [Candidatus Beckwithbacteria bacterium RBG_13_42_9]